MKKSKILTLIGIVLLLSTALLLSSCDENTGNNTLNTETTTEETAPEKSTTDEAHTPNTSISVNTENFVYKINEDGKSCTITGMLPHSTKVYIPQVIDGYTVTAIDDYVFSDCRYITFIEIPETVLSIGVYAFSNCTNLTSVTIPDSVTSIGDCAFGGCSRLTSVTIPDSVTSIGDSAFGGCSSLTSVTIPDSVTSIGYSAFYGCSSLTRVYYIGTADDWEKISFSYNEDLTSATRYYYSDTQPTDTTYKYWHYVDGVATEW